MATIMRQNSRFNTASPVKGEHGVLKGFSDIRRCLSPPPAGAVFQTIAPFIEVITSPETTGPMTGAALASCDHFIQAGVVSSGEDLAGLVEGVMACQFEQSDVTGDEIVISKMFLVLSSAFASPALRCLPPPLVVDTLHTVLRVNSEQRFSDMLRHHAQNALVSMAALFLSHLPSLPLAAGPSHAAAAHPPAGRAAALPSVVTWTLRARGGAVLGGAVRRAPSGVAPADPARASSAAPSEAGDQASPHRPDTLEGRGADGADGAAWADAVAAVLELLIGLVADAPGEALRAHAVALLHSLVEEHAARLVAAPQVRRAVTLSLVGALLRVPALDDPVALAGALSLFRALFANLGAHLRGHTEVAVAHLYLAPLEDKAAPDALREVALEGLCDLCALPSFLADLYVNFDCALHAPNLFERTAKLLCKSSFPVSGVLTPAHLLSFTALARGLDAIAARCAAGAPAHVGAEQHAAAERATAARIVKRRYAAAADQFNRAPKKGLQFLAAQGLLAPPGAAPPAPGAEGPRCPGALARFFRLTPTLDKRAVGEFLGERDTFNQEVLRAYAWLFDFAGDPIEEALRLFIESFLLPGESQKIERITDVFAQRFFEQAEPLPYKVDTSRPSLRTNWTRLGRSRRSRASSRTRTRCTCSPSPSSCSTRTGTPRRSRSA